MIYIMRRGKVHWGRKPEFLKLEQLTGKEPVLKINKIFNFRV